MATKKEEHSSMASNMLEVQGVATDGHDTFPYSGMRILGAIQIIIGILVFVLGVVDIILTMMSYDGDVAKYGSEYELIVSLTIASSPLWCGMWFAITGSLGTCISRDRAHTLQFFKIGFLVLNVLVCALFGPICAVVNGVIAYSRHGLACCNLQWLLTLIICFLSILEVAMATVSASVTCCCSPLRATQVHVIVNPRSVKGSSDFVTDRESSGVSRHAYGSGRSNNDNNLSANNLSPNHISHSHIPGDPDLPHTPSAHRPRQQPRVELQEPPIDGFSDSSGYPRLKKWALPHW